MAKKEKAPLFPPHLRPLFEWLCRYPLLLAEAVLLLVIVWDLFGGELGLKYLFWHEDLVTQTLAGFGAALFLAELCFVGYLLDADEPWMQRPRRHSLVWYLCATWIPLTALVAAAAFQGSGPAERWALPAGMLAGSLVAIGVGYLLLRVTRHRAGPPAEGEAPPKRRVLKRLPADPTLHVLAAAFFLLLAVFYGVLVLIGDSAWVSPALAICLLLGLVAGAYGFVVFHMPWRHFGVWMALLAVVIAAGGLSRYRHTIRGLESLYAAEEPVPLDAYPRTTGDGVTLLDDARTLEAWRESRAASLESGEKPKLAIVTVSGGGIRSAVWTGAVLSALEKSAPDFPYHVRLITGASGGMLGASYYVATLNEPGEETKPHGDDVDLVGDLARDSLTAVSRRFVLHDLPLAVWGAGEGDRGLALEKTWEENSGGALSAPLTDLADSEIAGWRPSLVFSPMLVEDGRRMLISNLDLRALTSAHRHQSAVQFFRLFPEGRDLRISTAARLSATFPYISPAVDLPTSPPRRVVDAAYYDTYGVNLAASWLLKNSAWIKENVSGVYLLQIRDATVDDQFEHSWSRPTPSTWPRALHGLSTPLEGALAARRSITFFRNEEQLDLLGARFNDESPFFFQTLVFELDEPAALSWYLTAEEIARIRQKVKGEDRAEQFAEFENIWNPPGGLGN